MTSFVTDTRDLPRRPGLVPEDLDAVPDFVRTVHSQGSTYSGLLYNKAAWLTENPTTFAIWRRTESSRVLDVDGERPGVHEEWGHEVLDLRMNSQQAAVPIEEFLATHRLGPTSHAMQHRSRLHDQGADHIVQTTEGVPTLYDALVVTGETRRVIVFWSARTDASKFHGVDAPGGRAAALWGTSNAAQQGHLPADFDAFWHAASDPDAWWDGLDPTTFPALSWDPDTVEGRHFATSGQVTGFRALAAWAAEGHRVLPRDPVARAAVLAGLTPGVYQAWQALFATYGLDSRALFEVLAGGGGVANMRSRARFESLIMAVHMRNRRTHATPVPQDLGPHLLDIWHATHPNGSSQHDVALFRDWPHAQAAGWSPEEARALLTRAPAHVSIAHLLPWWPLRELGVDAIVDCLQVGITPGEAASHLGDEDFAARVRFLVQVVG